MSAVFIALGVIGVFLLAVSLLLGEVLDGLFDAVGIDSGGLFSTEVVGAFLAALGFGGWLLSDGFGLPDLIAFAGGVGAGTVMGALALWVSRSLINMPTDATPDRGDIIGALGKVITPIPEGGLGEVTVSRHGQPLKLYARAERELAAGEQIVVIAELSSTSVIVSPTDL